MTDNRSMIAARAALKQQRRAPGYVTNRSRLTNRKWILAGVDMRTPRGRRFRDLCVGFALEAGGDPTETERALIRQAAAMVLTAETLQSAMVRGDVVNADDVIRLSSEARRILAPITQRASRRAKATAGPSALDEYLSREAAP
jgi:hypothetical protein